MAVYHWVSYVVPTPAPYSCQVNLLDTLQRPCFYCFYTFISSFPLTLPQIVITEPYVSGTAWGFRNENKVPPFQIYKHIILTA